MSLPLLDICLDHLSYAMRVFDRAYRCVTFRPTTPVSNLHVGYSQWKRCIVDSLLSAPPVRLRSSRNFDGPDPSPSTVPEWTSTSHTTLHFARIAQSRTFEDLSFGSFSYASPTCLQFTHLKRPSESFSECAEPSSIFTLRIFNFCGAAATDQRAYSR